VARALAGFGCRLPALVARALAASGTTPPMGVVSRRGFLASGALAAGAALSPAFLRAALAAPTRAGASPYGPLQPPDARGLMLPAGFRSREIARGLEAVAGTGYVWPIFSDGQAVFRTGDGGWILVTNSESPSASGGGSSAIRFGPGGEIRDAYRILGLTNLNCAGGPTPWGTWLSCEEHELGMVWECDPAGVLLAPPRPALGVFNHEAAAVDPAGRRLYLTEDRPDGGFYRFTPATYPALDDGLLEIAVVGADGSVSWREVPDPSSAMRGPTRHQVTGYTPFDGGEGIWHARGILYFTTKGDKRVWAYDPAAGRIEVLYDRALAQDASLDAVDNVTVSAAGEVFVCEDGGNMEIGLITPAREVSPFLRFTGAAHAVSEVTGVAFDPSGTRLYFTSQGAYPVVPGQRGPGAVYEVSGPFRTADAAAAFGPPAGEARPRGPLSRRARRRGPRLRVDAPRSVRRRSLLRRGLTVRVQLSEPVTLAVSFQALDLVRSPARGGGVPRPRPRRLALVRRRLRRAGSSRLRLRLSPPRRLALRRRRAFEARLIVTATNRTGRRSTVVRSLHVR
jgi:uncharacterized protein